MVRSDFYLINIIVALWKSYPDRLAILMEGEEGSSHNFVSHKETARLSFCICSSVAHG